MVDTSVISDSRDKSQVVGAEELKDQDDHPFDEMQNCKWQWHTPDDYTLSSMQKLTI